MPEDKLDGTQGLKEVSATPSLQFLRAAASGLISGNIIDDGHNLVRLEVETIGADDRITFRLVLSDELWAWKTMPVRTHIGGTWVTAGELGVNSEHRISTRAFTLDDLGGTIQLDFWKHGVIGLGAWVAAKTLNVSENLGKRLTFTWMSD